MPFVIHKYGLQAADSFVLDLPRGAKVLTVQVQHNEPKLWAIVDPTEPKEPRLFRLIPTGSPFETPNQLTYVGTFQLQNGALVFHLFEVATRS